mgnify:CR=1 FL=1
MAQLTQLEKLDIRGLVIDFPKDFGSTLTQLEVIYLNSHQAYPGMDDFLKNLRSLKEIRVWEMFESTSDKQFADYLKSLVPNAKVDFHYTYKKKE